jgi:type II secretory pathway pseudopilin PulG
MLMSAIPATTSRMRDQRGFSMIEALVAILTGVVVTGALFAILEVSLRQTARLTDVVQANQLGRGTMTKIVDELRSSCLSAGFAPIQEKSTEKTLLFVTAVSEHSVISKTEAFEHEIVFNEAKGTLTDTTYPATGGEYPKFAFSREKASSVSVIGESITKGTGESEGKVFRYYKYAEAASSGSEKPEGTLEEVKLSAGTELKASANEIAAVNVTFKTAPATDKTVFQGHVPVEFSNQTTLAFSAPASESKVQDTPCH